MVRQTTLLCAWVLWSHLMQAHSSGLIPMTDEWNPVSAWDTRQECQAAEDYHTTRRPNEIRQIGNISQLVQYTCLPEAVNPQRAK